jgi:dUTP pyrophosphatase
MSNEVKEITEVKENEILFAKVKTNAVIPSKKEEDAGFDIYACFDEDNILIYPHTTVMIPTGIASAFTSGYVMILKERGSTGIKGIAQRCGVIDSGFRGEWKVPITNTSEKKLIITKNVEETKKIYKDMYSDILTHGKTLEDLITIYPYEKAICQALLLPVPKVEIKETSFESLSKIKSERGNGMLGSSGK